MNPGDEYETGWNDTQSIDYEQRAAKRAYPNHHPVTALANYRAGREVWDTNGDLW